MFVGTQKEDTPNKEKPNHYHKHKKPEGYDTRTEKTGKRRSAALCE